MRNRNRLLAVTFVATVGLVGISVYSSLSASSQKTPRQRDPLITAPLAEQWSIFPAMQMGMDLVPMPAPETPAIGSIPRLDGVVPAKYEEGLLDEIVESSANGTVGFTRNAEPFDDRPMCYFSYSIDGEIQWMAHQGQHYNGTISAGEFADGVPHDGFFLLNLSTGRVIVRPDISTYFSGDMQPRHLGVVELINGRVAGMIHLYDDDTTDLIDQYVATRPEIRSRVPMRPSEARDEGDTTND